MSVRPFPAVSSFLLVWIAAMAIRGFLSSPAFLFVGRTKAVFCSWQRFRVFFFPLPPLCFFFLFFNLLFFNVFEFLFFQSGLRDIGSHCSVCQTLNSFSPPLPRRSFPLRPRLSSTETGSPRNTFFFLPFFFMTRGFSQPFFVH